MGEVAADRRAGALAAGPFSRVESKTIPSKTTKEAKARPKRISRLRRPEDMSLEDWQVILRRQFAKDQNFRMKNIGGRPVFSEFHVTNPQTKRTYRVAIRGDGLGMNYCSCPDFATNTLGTCKHIEFALAGLKARRGASDQDGHG